jgi:hypothetical protein
VNGYENSIPLQHEKSALSPLKSVRILSGCAALLFISGCGVQNVDPFERHAIRGTVTLDEEPLFTGTITFYPEKEGPVISGTTIQDGKFMILASQGLPPGRYKVSITATDESEAASLDPDELMSNPPNPVSLIPDKYNTATTILAEVEKTGDNVFNFDLKSQ